MPIFNNESLDDPIQFDVCDSFAGGQASRIRANRLNADQAHRLTNCDVERDGLCITRRGTLTLGGAAVVADCRTQGLFWYDSPTNEFLVAICAGVLYRLNGGAWALWGSTYAAANSAADVQIAQHQDRLYLADGTAPLQSFDGTTHVNLGSGGAANPPIGTILVSFTNRLVISGIANDPTAVHFSDFAAPPVWDTSGVASNGVIRVGYGENDPITCIVPFPRFNLLIGKTNSLHVVHADPIMAMATLDINPLHRGLGIAGKRAACQVGGDVWFFSNPTGVHSLQAVLAAGKTEIPAPISAPIQDVMDRVTWQYAHRSCVAFHRNRFFLSVPIDGSTEPNALLVFNTLTRSWHGRWTKLDPLCFATSASNDEIRFNFGRVDGKVSKWLDLEDDELASTFEDSGSPIETDVETRGMVLGEALCPKQPFNLEAEFHRSKATVTLGLILDENSEGLLTEFSTGSGVRTLATTLPTTLLASGTKRRAFSVQHLNQFREAKVRIYSPGGRLALRSVALSGFIETLKIEQ